MKAKSILYLSGMVLCCWNAQSVLADSITSDPKQLVALDQKNVGGKVQVLAEDNQVKVVLSGLTTGYRSPSATLWSQADKSDAVTVRNFVQDSSGNYVALLDRSSFSNEESYFSLDMSVQDDAGRSYSLETYEFDWSKENVATNNARPQFSVRSIEADEAQPEPSQAQARAVVGDLSFANVDAQAGTFDIIVSNVAGASAIQTVQVPVWTDENGQDDIRWYTATKQSDGNYKVRVNKKDHKNGTGKYNVHLYYRYTNGQMAGVSGTSTDLPAPAQNKATGDIAIDNINAQNGTFDVVVSNVSGSSAIQTVYLPIWTDANGQDDIRWYTATKQSDGTYKATVNKKDHKNGIGKYNVHLYYRYTNGQMAGIGATSTDLPAPAQNKATGDVVIDNINAQNGTFDVVVSNVSGSSAIQTVYLPIWTDANGQDDIRWYTATKQADGTYKATVNKKDHKNGTGKYNVHLYYRYTNGQMAGIGATSTDLPAPAQNKATGDIAIDNINAQAGTFDIIVSNVSGSSAIQTVYLPIWTDANGQDDIRWYTATKQSDGTYKATVNKKDHKNGIGKYNVHLYYRYTNGQMAGIGATSTDLPAPSQNKATGDIAINNINAQNGTFDVVVSNVSGSSAIQTVYLPIWTDANGQDDIRWYTATKQSDGNYKVTVNKKDHKNGTGKYNVHLYYRYTNGQMAGVSGTSTDLPANANTKSTGTIQMTNFDGKTGGFDVIVTDVSSPIDIDSVLVPVWSDAGGQDDIRWYSATRQSNGSYKVHVEASNHKYSTGLYHAHLYYKQINGQLVGVGATQGQVSIASSKPQASLRIENVDNTSGIFDVVVSNVFAPGGVTKVEVPVWSDVNGQNDIQWYEATKQADGTYRVTVRVSSHNYETGLYHAHLYITSNGQRTGIAGTTTNVTYTHKADKSFIDISSHNGSLSVSDYRNLLSQGVAGVVVKLTEGTSYTNPYAEEQIRNAKAVGMKVSVYHYAHFTDAQSAQAEARYFVEAARRFGITSDTVMVNDIEENKTRQNINANMKFWEAEMRRLGYRNLVHYTSASWIDVNTLGYSGPIQTGQFGLKNFWVAQYPYNSMTVRQAREMGMHASAAAWQFTSSAQLLSGRHVFDLNLDYTGRFTN